MPEPCEKPPSTAPQLDVVRTPIPPCRRLRAFAFDPILSRQIETYGINEVEIEIPWEEDADLGPTDSYLEVIDYDPASQAFYAPVYLNEPKLLAQDGLPPSEGNPQFHQQMVYAVARRTIDHFEQALGRRALWSSRRTEVNGKYEEEYVEHLRIYPHALREANAYYSSAKKALLFGYFPASSEKYGQNMPGETVFACLSHDIVAHETTHALVDGLHPRFLEPSNVDVLALHEALADVVALFQHFTYPSILKNQIARTKGNLQDQSLLGELAFQFGQAIGKYGALRNAIGSVDPKTHEWMPKQPNPEDIQLTKEPHDRGAIFVAAVFDAFLTIYKKRIQDLLRLASSGTGILNPGEISPDLVDRLAEEAAKTAGHILQICIRALDYCPPIDTDFGDYLRALITADESLVSYDPQNYRLAIIDAFRRRGIYPRDVRNLSVESLLWHKPSEKEQGEFEKLFHGPKGLQELVPRWDKRSDPEQIFLQARESRRALHEWLIDPKARAAAQAARLLMDKLEKNRTDAVYRDGDGLPMLEIHSIRPARRIGPDNQTVTELVIEITQRRRGYFDVEKQRKVESGELAPTEPDFILRGGCTLLVDPGTAKVRYCIYKDVTSQNRLDRMRRYLQEGSGSSLQATYLGNPSKEYFDQSRKNGLRIEPLALLHRSMRIEEVM
jgi:hypothetical protein